MNGGWEIGDLALCVDDGPAIWLQGMPECNGEYIGKLRKGRIYQIALIGGESGLTAFLMECGAGGLSHRFRKIKPDAEPCEEEFTVLIKRMKPAKVES